MITRYNREILIITHYIDDLIIIYQKTLINFKSDEKVRFRLKVMTVFMNDSSRSFNSVIKKFNTYIMTII